MKRIFQILLFIFVTTGVAQNENFNRWVSLANEDPSLQPEYGNIQKTEEQQESDKNFVDQLLSEYKGDRQQASNKMVQLGFQYLYQKRDLVTAMRRFNQAYLLDPENADLYYGFGTVYFNLGAMEEARQQYDKGLEINPEHFQILTDYGTTYLGEYYNESFTAPSEAKAKLDLSLNKLLESYEINPTYSSTTYKLSILYLLKEDCENSRKFLDLTKEIDRELITQEYMNEFNLTCRKDELDCSKIRTGKFKIEDELSGVTLITRTEDFQIEENKELNQKLKLSITWLDDCTYQLKPVEDLLDPKAELPTMILTCYITEVNDNQYQQISVSDASPLRLWKEIEILE